MSEQQLNILARLFGGQVLRQLEGQATLARSLQEGIPDPFFTVDTDMTITSINRRDACGIAGG